MHFVCYLLQRLTSYQAFHLKLVSALPSDTHAGSLYEMSIRGSCSMSCCKQEDAHQPGRTSHEQCANEGEDLPLRD